MMSTFVSSAGVESFNRSEKSMSIYQNLFDKKEKLAVIGLGYVGLPIALAFGRKIPVIGFDTNSGRIELLNQGIDPAYEMDASDFEGCDISFTSDPEKIREASFYIVAVPTPVDEHKVPFLGHLYDASEVIGRVISPGNYVVFESTVYPGCTEDDCIPVLEAESGLKFPTDFKVGYSPERINPGDKEHRFESIIKVISAQDARTLDIVADVYGSVVKAGIHRAPSIKVAEAAKVIENTQRDLNIAFMRVYLPGCRGPSWSASRIPTVGRRTLSLGLWAASRLQTSMNCSSAMSTR